MKNHLLRLFLLVLALGLQLGACTQIPGREAAPADMGLGARALEGPYPLLRVVDGDTLWIRRNGRVEKLRLQAVDTEECHWPGTDPQRGHPATVFGDQTARWTRDYFNRWCAGERPAQLRLALPTQGPERDAFGRLLCHVFLPDGTHFNRLLIQEGKSPYYNKYGASFWAEKTCELAEEEAKEARVGIWSETNQARAEAPPYHKLRPWWDARAAALQDYQGRLRAGQAILDASQGADLRQAWSAVQAAAGQPIMAFGSIQRFYEEDDGALTALLHTGEMGKPLRLVLPPTLRGTELEKILRKSHAEFRQNYLYVRGPLTLGRRGIRMVANPDSLWYPAGPEPLLPGG